MPAPMILPFSRSAGKNTIVFMPAFAPCAATAPARLPVEAQASTSNSNSKAFAVATDTTLSLNENVGFTLSFLIYRLSSPSARPRFLALTSGVNPVPMSSTYSLFTGSSSWYRHIVSGPLEILSRLMLFPMLA